LIERLHLRRCPELHFQIDKSHAYEARVDELLGRTKKRSGTKPSDTKPNAEKSGT